MTNPPHAELPVLTWFAFAVYAPMVVIALVLALPTIALLFLAERIGWRLRE